MEVDKPFTIKPDTLLLTTSITYCIMFNRRQDRKMWKVARLSVLRAYTNRVYPKIKLYSKLLLARNRITQIVKECFKLQGVS